MIDINYTNFSINICINYTNYLTYIINNEANFNKNSYKNIEKMKNNRETEFSFISGSPPMFIYDGEEMKFYQNDDNGLYQSNSLIIYKIKNNEELLLICEQLLNIYNELKFDFSNN